MCWIAKSGEANEGTAIRRSITQYLKDRVNERDALLEAEIVIGELLGNALRHSPGTLCADVEWRSDHRPVLSVHDGGPCFEEPSAPGDRFAESGRGMPIVRALSDDLRIRRIKPRGCVVSVALRLTKRPDWRSEPTMCPRGESRWDLGCACALEVHGRNTSEADVNSVSRAG